MIPHRFIVLFTFICLTFQNHLQKVQIYGGISAFAYYFADILIGSPNPQVQSVIIDTGSPSLAIPCYETCSLNNNSEEECGNNHFDKFFNVTSSKTARWLPCNQYCQCQSNKCMYTLQYGEGSSLYGYWISDFISLGHSKMANHPVYATFGCHTKVTDLFLSQKANGIMGLAFSYSRDYISTIDSFFADSPADISRDIFSLCLSYEGGEMSVGGWDPRYAPLEGVLMQDHYERVVSGLTPPQQYIQSSTIPRHFNATEKIAWTPFVDPAMYVVLITGIKSYKTGNIEYIRRDIGGLYTLVDSGATRSSMPFEVYAMIEEIVTNGCSKMPGGCAKVKYITSTKRVCVALPRGQKDLEEFFDPIVFEMKGGQQWSFPSTSYFFPTISKYHWCLGVRQRDEIATIGAAFFANALLVFDRDKERMGYKPNIPCPTYEIDSRERNNNQLAHGTTLDGRTLDSASLSGNGEIHPYIEIASAEHQLAQQRQADTTSQQNLQILTENSPISSNSVHEHEEIDVNDEGSDNDDHLPIELKGFGRTSVEEKLKAHLQKLSIEYKDKLQKIDNSNYQSVA